MLSQSCKFEQEWKLFEQIYDNFEIWNSSAFYDDFYLLFIQAYEHSAFELMK